MFEKAQFPAVEPDTRFAGVNAQDGDLMVARRDASAASAEHGGGALRMIEWNDLTARLKAARDLRHLLRCDANGNIEAGGGSFADAAARYFREREECEPVVNPVALERSKGSSGMISEYSELDEKRSLSPSEQDRKYAATGDARED